MKVRCILLFLTIAGCQAAPLAHEECEERFARWEASIAEHSGAFDSKRVPDRRPAFSPKTLDRTFQAEPTAEDRRRLLLTDESQDEWMGRAEDELKATQGWLERMNDDPSRRLASAELNAIANRWVTFHGLAFQKRTDDMRRVLAEIRERMRGVRTHVCQPNPLAKTGTP